DFESVTLGDSVNERLGGKTTVVETTPNTFPYPDAFTHTPPSGWNIDNSGGLPGIGDPAVGVEEWEGWSFANPKFWTFAAMEGRQLFTKGTGVVAVADPDEWDDLGNPEGIGTFNSMLETPSIDISSLALAPGALSMKFDSSWDDEDTQTAIIEVDYGSGYVEVLRWESDPLSPFFHDTNYNETVLLALDNPLGATTARIRFGLVNSTDDWWWAVDNIRVGVIPEPATTVLISLAMSGLALFGFRRRS
ncbi:MAG: PEP-CTERM sorting domain-containing protein, partial [Pirellulales bacterium]